MARPKRGTTPSAHPKRVTMQDIADAAHVHIMTVSNALGNTRSVAPETRERVLRIAQELNYIPNTVARALGAGKTGIIAVLAGAMNESYYATIVHHLENYLDEDGYRLMLLKRPHEVYQLVNSTGSSGIDGAIAIDIFHWRDEFQSHPAVPCVSIGTYEHNHLDYVVVDLAPAVQRALEIMLSQGRKRIAYVVNTPYLAEPAEVRAGAYLKFMEAAGRKPEIIVADTSFVGPVVLPHIAAKFREYIEENGCPDALLCLNDETAMSAYSVFRDMGKRIPEDVLLVGCDGQLHMEFFAPPLSTISQPLEEMCGKAWEFLKQRIEHPEMPLQRAVLRGELRVRESLIGR